MKLIILLLIILVFNCSTETNSVSTSDEKNDSTDSLMTMEFTDNPIYTIISKFSNLDTFFTAHFFDTLHGVAATVDGRIYLTDDYCDTWTLVDTLENIKSCTMLSIENILYINARLNNDKYEYVRYTSTDSGKIWSEIEQIPYGSITMKNSIDSICLRIERNDLFISEDSGLSWDTYHIFQSIYRNYGILFLDKNRIVVIGEEYYDDEYKELSKKMVRASTQFFIYQTIDGGNTWTKDLNIPFYDPISLQCNYQASYTVGDSVYTIILK